nr:uncharacterized protein LOC112034669 [Quercus suber]
MFFAHDAGAILSTPLSNRLPPNKIIWAANKNGRFSVRSAYRLAMEEFWKGRNGVCSDCSTMKQVWKRIWGLETPNKIRTFFWKACHNILATKENLLKRHITTDDKCEECGRTWDFVDVVWQIVRSDSASPNLLEKVAAICWGIWKNRCEVQHGGIIVQVVTLHAGRYKLNVGGAIFSQSKATGLGMVICDDAGLVVAAMSKKISFPLGPLEAEAKAMEAAIQFAFDIGIREVTFETDSLLLYNALQGNNAAASSIENVVSGILSQIQNFRFADFSHIKRLGNLLSMLNMLKILRLGWRKLLALLSSNALKM